MASKALSVSTGPIEKIDPFAESAGLLLVIAFNKSSSPNFPLALTMAKTAQRFVVADIGGRIMHVVGFAKNQADAGKAAAFMGYANTWKGVMVFSNGALVSNTKRLSIVLDCYLQSCACRDPKAHCRQVIDDPLQKMERSPYEPHITPVFSAKMVDIRQRAFPCKLLRPAMRFQSYLDATPGDQIQAAGVKHGCSICPRFDPDDFPDVGSYRTTVHGYY